MQTIHTKQESPVSIAGRMETYVARFGPLLAIALTFFYVLRVWRFAVPRAFWFDELGTLFVSTQPTLQRMFVAAAPDGQPPVNYFLVRASIKIFGVSEFAARLPAFCFMMLGLVSLYLFLRKSCSPITCALVPAMFIGAELITYAAEARPYAGLFGMVALLLLLWQRAAEGRWGWWMAPALGICCVVLVLLQPYGVLYLAPLMIAEGVRWWRSRRINAPVLVGLLLGFCAVPVLFWFTNHTKQALFSSLPPDGIPFSRPNFEKLVETVNLRLTVYSILPLLLGVLALESFRSTWQRICNASAAAQGAVAALVSLLLMIPGVYLLTCFTTHYYWSRYSIPTSLAVIACTVLLFEKGTARALLSIGLLFGMVFGTRHMNMNGANAIKGLDPVLLSVQQQSLPVVMADALMYPTQWYYAPAKLRSQMWGLSDLARMKAATIDWMPDITLTAHMRRGTYPLQLSSFDDFTTTHREFLLYVAEAPVNRDWVLPSLSPDEWEIHVVSRNRYNSIDTFLYHVQHR